MTQTIDAPPEEFEGEKTHGGVIQTLAPGNGALATTPRGGQDLIIRAELDVQITTAKTYPRDTQRCVKTAIQMATWNPAIANDCIYAKPVGGRVIRGPSVRLAEIMVSTWGNLRVTPRIVDMDQRFVTVECEVWDLESNVKTAWVVRRRLTDRYGKPYPEHVVENTIGAATAIAMRNSVFKVIPKAYAEIIYQECAKIVVGDAKSMADKRADVLKALANLGAEKKRVLAYLGVEKEEMIDPDMLVTLRGLGNAIRDGEVTIEEAFAVRDTEGSAQAPARGVQAARAAVQRGRSATTAPEPPVAAAQPEKPAAPVSTPPEAGQPDFSLAGAE